MELKDKIDIGIKLVGALGVIAGIFFTACQIRSADETEKAKLIYQIQKDGRELFAELSKNSAFLDCVILDSDCKPDEISKIKASIVRAMQFYTSVYNQKELGKLLPNYWSIWKVELCDFVSRPAVVEFWKKSASRYREPFRQEVEACLGDSST